MVWSSLFKMKSEVLDMPEVKISLRNRNHDIAGTTYQRRSSPRSSSGQAPEGTTRIYWVVSKSVTMKGAFGN